jgi:hypothetical protein
MPSLLYPESAWPARFGRFVRALQIVAIAGTIGAVGGGAAVLAVMGSGPPHKLAIVGPDSDDAAKAVNATKAVGDAQGSPQSSGPAVALPAPAASPAPVVAPPASGTPRPAQLAAAAAEPAAAAPQNSGPAAAPAASEIDNRAKTAERVHARSAKLRAKENRRQRSVASRYARERDWRNYDPYQQGERGTPERGFDSGAFQRRVETGANARRGYSYYDSAPRTGYWGGGSMFGGNWGSGGWGN